MSTVTDNLKMFVYEPDIDGIQTFNIDRCIGDNFKKIDKMLNVYSYDSTFTYSAGMHVLDNGIIYKSLTDNNIGKALTNTTYWSKDTGKSKIVSLSGAVSGSATFNTGDTNTVSIYTTLSKLSSSNFNSSGLSNMFKAMTANFNAGVSMAINTTHTATSDGYINWVCNEVSTTRDLKINDIIVASVRAGGEGDDCKTAALLPIAKGSTYWCNKGTLTFYPLNGV